MIAWIIILVTNCWLSEKVAKQAKCLKNKIMEGASYHTVSDDSNYICSLLDDFKGFDGNGFFTLDHSLLTGMTGNFVTLMVILIQFKQSEEQSKLSAVCLHSTFFCSTNICPRTHFSSLKSFGSVVCSLEAPKILEFCRRTCRQPYKSDFFHILQRANLLNQMTSERRNVFQGIYQSSKKWWSVNKQLKVQCTEE